MLKQKRRYDRVSSCSQLSQNRSDMTLRRRNTSGESDFVSSEKRPPPSCVHKNRIRRENTSNRGKSNVENEASRRKNSGKMGKKKILFRKRTQRAFKNTIVLAPFHALKQFYQKKLKDLYRKGLLENKAKRLEITNNSVFKYEIMEMKANGEEPARKGENLGESSSRKRKPDTTDRVEHHHCVRGGRKLDEERSGPSTGIDLPSTSLAMDHLARMTLSRPKKSRVETPVNRDKQSRCAEGRKSLGQSRAQIIKKSRRISARKHDKSQPRKAGKKASKANDFKYKTRSVTRKQTAQPDGEGKGFEERENRNEPMDDENPTEEKVRSWEDGQSEEIGGANLDSNSSVLILAEISSPKGEGIYCGKSERIAEEGVPTMSAVPPMLDTLFKCPVKSSGEGAKMRNSFGGGAKRSPSNSSEEQPDGEVDRRGIEANVVVQESTRNSSSSERISEDSRTFKTEKAAAYVFGPKCPFRQIRESCGFPFGLSQNLSDDEIDEYEPSEEINFKKHR